MTSPLSASTSAAPAFIQQLREARLAAGITQATLARRLGWSTPRFGTYENAQRAIHPPLAEAWANQLGLTITTRPIEAHCRACGCTEERPCEGGCRWVTSDTGIDALCSRCALAITRESIASGLYALANGVTQ